MLKEPSYHQIGQALYVPCRERLLLKLKKQHLLFLNLVLKRDTQHSASVSCLGFLSKPASDEGPLKTAGKQNYPCIMVALGMKVAIAVVLSTRSMEFKQKAMPSFDI